MRLIQNKGRFARHVKLKPIQGMLTGEDTTVVREILLDRNLNDALVCRIPHLDMAVHHQHIACGSIL
jgi:hypothetical protein